ncbi:M23 family metallopeptidase [uncultured Sunxiuqinia sp.]|uniref:M23 family metallopeptidase n=1 Tax=uncultured Sunxiuqinia sp. TaxID=1573825 RepID=UPI00260B3084|nr:M23 family metallopeptidase [uncultured Sunxiuqinia sp.]
MKKYIAEVVFLLAATSLFVLFSVNPPAPKPEPIPEPEPIPIPEPVLLFGLPADSFHIETRNIQRNQNLSDILVKKNISYQMIDQLARKSKAIFDVRKIKHKNPYHFFLKKDSLQTPAYFIYEIDNTDYVVYQLGDSINIYRGQKPIHRQLRTASGTIKSSLWNAMTENNINPVLANELSDIYQWTIDFYGIQRGDQFRVIYEEMYVDSTPIGIGEIFACQFQHMKQDFYAFQFEQDSSLSYFDQEGNSLKKAFLKSPLEFSRISSRFSNSRYHPVLKIRRPHHGVDYAAPTGTPVRSIGDGVVTRKAYQRRGGGNYVYIKHNSVYTTCYMHLHGYAKGIAPGVRVKQGQIIGYVGATGLATGPHLDFRVFRNGSPMDPLKVEAPPVEPVHEANKAAFEAVKDSLSRQLELIPLSS